MEIRAGIRRVVTTQSVNADRAGGAATTSAAWAAVTSARTGAVVCGAGGGLVLALRDRSTVVVDQAAEWRCEARLLAEQARSGRGTDALVGFFRCDPDAPGRDAPADHSVIDAELGVQAVGGHGDALGELALGG